MNPSCLIFNNKNIYSALTLANSFHMWDLNTGKNVALKYMFLTNKFHHKYFLRLSLKALET